MDELRALLSRCVKCGRCRGVCPVFQAVNRETAVARGKLALVEAALEIHDQLNSRLGRSLSMCLLCGACTANCPNEARAHEAIRRCRALLARDAGMTLPKRMLSRLTTDERPRRDRFARGASTLQRLLTRPDAEDRGVRFRLPLRRFHQGWIPSLTPPFFLERAPRELPASNAMAKVGLFVGCAIHYLAPQVGEAAVGLLRQLGFTVVIPKQQGCCGLMAHSMGDDQAAHGLAFKTVQAFDDPELEAIVVPCASCAAHLRNGFPSMLPDAGGRFSERVMELSLFLEMHGLTRVLNRGSGTNSGQVVTYHDPCHLSRSLGIRQEPRSLLAALRTISFRDMDGAERCCGMGGSFRLAYPGISRRILAEKVKAIYASEAQVVATGCMGCWIQLQEGLDGGERKVEVVHLAEILWRGLEGSSC